jgi:hypothetical protein
VSSELRPELIALELEYDQKVLDHKTSIIVARVYFIKNCE